MNNSKVLLKYLKIVLIVAFGTFLLYSFSSIWITNTWNNPFGERKSIKIEGIDLYNGIKDFSVEQNTIVSLTNDPYLLFDNIDITPTYIKIDIQDISKDTTVQIFYAKQEEGFSEDKSVRHILRKGKNIVQLPVVDSYSGKLRIDLTNEANVTIVLKSVEISNRKFISSLHLSTFLLLESIFLIILFFYFFMSNLKNKLGMKIDQLNEPIKAKIILFFLISISVLIIFGKVIIDGNTIIYTDIGSDTLNGYYPAYNYLVNHLKDLDFSSWTFQHGLGIDTLNFSPFIFDPFSLFVVIGGVVFGNGMIPLLIFVSYIFRIFACAFLCYKYLGFFSVSEKSKVIASYIYGFNGFLILWGQHYHFGTFCFWGILMLVFIEKILKSDKIKINIGFVVVTVLTISFYIYCAYMLLLFSGIYIIFRILNNIEEIKFKKSIKKFLSFVISTVIGICLSAMTFLPQAFSLLKVSNRLDSSIGILEKLKIYFFQWPNKNGIYEYFERMLSNNLRGIGDTYSGSSNYYEVPQLFFSIFFIILLVQYVVNLNKKHLTKIQVTLRYCAILLVGLLIFNPMLSMVLNGFAYPMGRYTYILMPLFALLTAVTLDDIIFKKLNNLYALVASVILVAFVLGFNKIPAGQVKEILSLEILDCFLLIFFSAIIIKNNFNCKKKSKSIYLFLLSSFLLNIVADSFLTINVRSFLPNDSKVVSEVYGNTNTFKAIEYIKKNDSGFYRIDKTYFDNNSYSDSLIQEYFGVSTYNSTMNKYLKDFNNNFMNRNYTQIKDQKLAFLFSPYDLSQYTLLGVKYILSKDLPQNMEHFELLNQFGDIYILKNKNVENSLAFYHDLIFRKDFDNLTYAQKVDIFSKALVVEDKYQYLRTKQIDDIYNKLNLKDITSNTTKLLNGSSITQALEVSNSEQIILFENLKDKENVYFQFDILPSEDGQLFIQIDTGDGYLQKYLYQETLISGSMKSIKYLLPLEAKSIKISSNLNLYTINDFKVIESEHPLIPKAKNAELNYLDKEDKLIGKISADEEGYLFIPIVYQDGWKAKVDGVTAEIIRADAGFMALEVSSGEHTFELHYTSPYFKIGMIISICTFVLLVIYGISKKYMERVK